MGSVRELRQNTAIVIVIGGFVDVTDGVTAETGITLAAADDAEILKNGSGTVVDISGRTWTHIQGGQYNISLLTTDVDTLGPMKLFIRDESVCLAVEEYFMVLSQAHYDAKYGSGGVTVDAFTISAKAELQTEAQDALIAANLDHLVKSGSAPAAASGSYWDTLNGKVDTIDTNVDSTLSEVASPNGTAITGTLTASTFTTDLTEAVDNYWKDAWVKFKTGSLAGQVKKISAYTGATKLITVEGGFTSAPSNGDTFEIINR